MNTEQILNLDCRVEANKVYIQKVLKTIKPLKKYADEDIIPLEKLEKLVFLMQNKYEAKVSMIIVSSKANEKSNVYTAAITNNEGKMIKSVHGITLYELFSKIVIKLWAESRKGK